MALIKIFRIISSR